MSIRKLPGTPTVNAEVFWEVIAESKGWKVQYNKTLDTVTPLKPYRLLDPEDYLWVSADTAKELVDNLPRLMKEIAEKKPVITNEQVKAAAEKLISILIKRIPA